MTTRPRECDPLVSAARATRLARPSPPLAPSTATAARSCPTWGPVEGREPGIPPRTDAPPTANTAKPPKDGL
jgi:hypothetical protein